MTDHALIGRIYDCAANPELWPQTLSVIRDRLDAAYVGLGVTDVESFRLGRPNPTIFRNSEWDANWLATLNQHMHTMPGLHSLVLTEIDQSWMQMQQCSQADFQASEFYKEVIAPKGLLDCINVPFIRRPATAGMLTVTASTKRGLFSVQDANFVVDLAPHVRRAMAISDMVDRGRLELALLKSVLGSISVATFVVGISRRILFANAEGERLLASGQFVVSKNGAIAVSQSGVGQAAFGEALDCAAAGDEAMGLRGIGVPLISQDGERAAAYMLPISGKDIRGDMGDGYCSVFIARRGEQMPVTIEVLRTLFDMTQAEARTAALVAKGDTPAAIAEALGLSINTVRTQIAKALSKADVDNMTALAGQVNALVPPVLG